ncbi:complement factor H-related protein 1-like [Spinachia spinachia]
MGWGRYLGFVLLVWSQAFQHVRPSDQPCSAPELIGGFLVPELNSYDRETKLHYGCDNGRKPAVEGWWATSTCLDGKWSPQPQCIDENACMEPDIPNARKPSGWYEGKKKIRITCAAGYELKDNAATTTCTNGTWSPVLLCERSIDSCGEPPQIAHAVILHQGYQQVFADNTKLQYECEDGYSVEGADSLHCVAGRWREGPVCSSKLDTENVAVSTDRETQPDAGGMSTTPGLNEGDIKPLYTKVQHCGEYQNIANGDVVEQNDVFLKYQCNAYYTRVGSDIVTCNSNGSWSHLPICKDAFCILDPARLANLKPSANYYIKEGEENSIPCVWPNYFRKVECINDKMVYTECCYNYDHYIGACCYSTSQSAWRDQPSSEPRGSTRKPLYRKMCPSSQ